MNWLVERIIDTVRFNLGVIPEKAFYIEFHVEEGNIQVVRKLLTDDPELIKFRDYWGNSLLHLAADAKQVEMVRLLISFGCDVHAKNEIGETPLHSAAIAESREVSEVLLQAGADPSVVSKEGNTAADCW